MGDATYSMELVFRSEKEARDSFKSIGDFFKEGICADDFFNETRNPLKKWKGREPNDHRQGEAFWPVFKEKFPLITEYLIYSGLFGGSLDDLSFVIWFGAPSWDDEELKRLDTDTFTTHDIITFMKLHLQEAADKGVNENLSIAGNVIHYQNEWVWHFANWQPMAEFLKEKFNLQSCYWENSEGRNSANISEWIETYKEIRSTMMRAFGQREPYKDEPPKC